MIGALAPPLCNSEHACIECIFRDKVQCITCLLSGSDLEGRNPTLENVFLNEGTKSGSFSPARPSPEHVRAVDFLILALLPVILVKRPKKRHMRPKWAVEILD